MKRSSFLKMIRRKKSK